ncbi:MAG: zinc ABC transporter substrate-binding protein, partial [Syntrophales bacterium]|nr:zinc ABC transporter substrate-binding protein [Syntrophales bacterium]
RYRHSLKRCNHREIIHAGHFAFGYLARRYSLTYVSAFPGLMPDAEPTPQRIAQIIDAIKTRGVPYIYSEELVNPKVAAAIAQETGVQILVLHGAHNVTKEEKESGVTFIALMERNLDALVKGLSCR